MTRKCGNIRADVCECLSYINNVHEDPDYPLNSTATAYTWIANLLVDVPYQML